MNRAWKQFDLPLLIATLILSVIGLFAIFDAGYVRSLAGGHGSIPREFSLQVIFLCAGLAVFAGVSLVRPNIWRNLSIPIWALSLAALLLVLKFGKTQNGAQRWIQVMGMQIQPAEFVKVATIMLLATLLATRKLWPSKIEKSKNFSLWVDSVALPKLKRCLPAVLVGATVLLINHEKDLGTAAVVGVILIGMLLLGGVTTKSLIALVIAAGIGAGVMVKMQPYRMERITHHLERWNDENIDDSGYQTVHSELAMAAGGVKGVGVGSGQAKHVLPATTTDFIMATISEEFGLIGTLTVLGILALIVMRLFTIATRATTRYGRLVCYGVGIWLTVQGCVNLMMANATLPAIGIPFPFISSGGSSLIAIWFALGVCQSCLQPEAVKEEADAPSGNRRRNRRTRLSGTRSRKARV